MSEAPAARLCLLTSLFRRTWDPGTGRGIDNYTAVVMMACLMHAFLEELNQEGEDVENSGLITT